LRRRKKRLKHSQKSTFWRQKRKKYFLKNVLLPPWRDFFWLQDNKNRPRSGKIKKLIWPE